MNYKKGYCALFNAITYAIHDLEYCNCRDNDVIDNIIKTLKEAQAKSEELVVG